MLLLMGRSEALRIIMIDPFRVFWLIFFKRCLRAARLDMEEV